MASSINASITSSGIVQTADASGNLVLQGNGTTGLTIDNTGKVLLPNIALAGTASVGMLEYNGTAPYFTPQGTQRGVVPGMQYYVLNSGLTGTQATTGQNWLGVGVTLSSNTVYAFEAWFAMSKSAGTTAHSISALFAGTATVNSINYFMDTTSNSNTSLSTGITTSTLYSQTASATVFTGVGLQGNPVAATSRLKGFVSINTGGTFIPQYLLSAAPGGTWTVAAGSYMLIYPIGAAGGNISVGTWA